MNSLKLRRACVASPNLIIRHSALEAIDTALVGAAADDNHHQAVLYSVRAAILEQVGDWYALPCFIMMLR